MNSVSSYSVRQLEESLTRQFYSSCGGRYKFSIPLALVLSVALWEVVPYGRILAWLIVALVSQASSQALCAAFGRVFPVGNISIYWKAGLAVSVAIDSLVYGSAGIFLFPADSMAHQFILALFLACIGGLAAVTYSVHLPSGIISVSLVVLPLCGTFFSQGSEFSLTMGAVLLLFAAGLIAASVQINGVLLKFLTLRFEKDKLIASLSEEKEKMEELNGLLEAEVLERQLVAESLRRSEDRYRAVVEGQTELVCRLLGDYGLSFSNEAYSRYFGISSEELLGRNFLEFIHPDDLETARSFFELVGSGPSSRALEQRVKDSDGKIRWLQWTYRAIHDKLGQVKEFQGVGRDITIQRKAEDALRSSHEELEQRVQERTAELQEMNRKLQLEIADRIKAEKSLRDSEQRFRTIFEKARDCIFVKDRKLKYSHLNPAMQAIFEASESDIIGMSDEDLYGYEQAKRLKSEDVRVLGGQVIEAEHTLNFKGRELTFNCVKVPMMDSSGDVFGLCGIARDVTERLRTQMGREKGDLEFKSSSMRRTLNQVRLAAKSDSLVLLLGESGSGKDFLALHVHHLSHRSGGPFFAINCAALAPEIAESELFGHEAGSFTGARSRKRGMLELAEGGTLLLNEIGELSLILQAKLLTFLDTRTFTRVGGESYIEVSARIIAATNRELGKEAEAGRFRHDLFYRLNVFSLQVPPLRERLEDLPLLVDTILSQLCAKLGYGEIPLLDARCLSILSEYHWPGNVRELRNVLERALILSEGGKIKPEEIRLLDRQDVLPDQDGWCHVVRFPKGPENLNDVSKHVKSELMKEALRRASGVKKDAATLLGISVDSFKHQSKSLDK
ncbi:MAG: sigma 54-interacting transcriptional regulator [Desulfomonile tiedjei]|uniref:Sigma 54-interacting transcriptional regulator n=1 Tax=Desulfomonile tiedjei TaxID=2358 RepID=A0A9D6V5E2_9BACT|nr:sigma 54-interacting transcriptional regulator [Desulfomonile tiedjei]